MIEFENYNPDLESNTKLPKVIYWYALETKHKGPINAKYCNKLAKNELKDFFDKYPEQANDGVTMNISGISNITEEDKKFFKREIFGKNKSYKVRDYAIKHYKECLEELEEIPSGRLSQIYIIPSTMYDGFWGKNGYRSYDFILGDMNLYGWIHWEGDVFHIISQNEFDTCIDCKKNNILRLFTTKNFIIHDFNLSDMTIEVVK